MQPEKRERGGGGGGGGGGLVPKWLPVQEDDRVTENEQHLTTFNFFATRLQHSPLPPSSSPSPTLPPLHPLLFFCCCCQLTNNRFGSSLMAPTRFHCRVESQVASFHQITTRWQHQHQQKRMLQVLHSKKLFSSLSVSVERPLDMKMRNNRTIGGGGKKKRKKKWRNQVASLHLPQEKCNSRDQPL